MRGETPDVMKGSRVIGLPRRNRTYPAGRVCAAPGCGTRLSIYNKGKHCWQHQPVQQYVSRDPGGRKRKAA